VKTTMNLKQLAMAIGVSAAALATPTSFAEETSTSGAGALSTAARLDFRVIINRFLRLRVGTDAPAGTIDQITFDVPALITGDGTNVAGTGGDAGGGTAANVRVQSNAGQVTLTETNNSAGAGLGDGAGNTIPYTEVLTASSLGALPAPTLSNAGGNTSLPTLNAAAVTNRTAVWTYTYDNTAIYSAGTYGTSANGGRVTYTATTP